MIKDIEIPETKDVSVAICPNLEGDEQWEVHLVNNGNESLKNILVNSSGFGTKEDGEEVKTSTLRHFFDEVDALASIQIERIDPSVFSVNNEYWISFWINDKLFDKRFLFVPGSLHEKNLIFVSLLEKEAVLHA